MAIVKMGKFTAVGMRTKIEEPDALTINTCGLNDRAERGSFESWAWSNPTNRAIVHEYEDVKAVSVEALWQSTKIFTSGGMPNAQGLAGNWRLGKGKRPIGAWAGAGKPLITSPGEARRKIYLPAFKNLVEHWLKDPVVQGWIDAARQHKGSVYLRDHDTGRGIDRNGPMSHAYVLATYLNTGEFPA